MATFEQCKMEARRIRAEISRSEGYAPEHGGNEHEMWMHMEHRLEMLDDACAMLEMGNANLKTENALLREVAKAAEDTARHLTRFLIGVPEETPDTMVPVVGALNLALGKLREFDDGK